MKLGAALLPALLAALPLRGNAEPGRTGAPVLNRPVGARTSALGRAVTALPGEPESLLYNPAGAAFLPRGGALLAYMNGFAGGGYGLAAGTLLRGRLALTPGLLYYDSGAMDLNLSAGGGGRVTAAADRVLLLSAAYRLRENLALGATLKAVRLELAETAVSSSRHYDLGLLYRLTPAFSFGAAALNGGQDIRFESEPAPAPSALRAGAAWRFAVDPELFAEDAGVAASDGALLCDWSRVRGERGYAQAGAELNMVFQGGLTLALRGGWLFGRPDESFTFGLGLRRGDWNVALGYEASRDLDARLPVSVAWGF